MLTNTKFALSLAIVLGTASAGLAATKHHVQHHRVAVERQLSGANAYGYANGSTNPATTTSGQNDPYNHQAVKCIGGACDPEWGIDDSE
jgi:hypothetical protein